MAPDYTSKLLVYLSLSNLSIVDTCVTRDNQMRRDGSRISGKGFICMKVWGVRFPDFS